MIKNRKDLHFYLLKDAEANNEPLGGVKQRVKWFINPRLRFTRNLRYYEYYANQPQTILNRCLKYWFYYIHKRLSYKLGYSIDKNTFGPGVIFCHVGTIVVNHDAKIGANCRIHVDVNIGGSTTGVPRIGNDVYIGPGAKIFGGVTIGDHVKIGANAVVNKNVPDWCVIAGVPAKVIKKYNMETQQWESV